MKIVHYMFGLPPVRTGGLFRYALDLAAEQKKLGLEVILLLPGAIQAHGNKIAIHYWKKWNTLPCYRIKNPLYIPNGYGVIEPDAFMTPCDKRVYSDWLRKVQPDVIHMHSLMGIHTEFLDAANEENIPIIYTTHDYYGLCPKIDLMEYDHECCNKDWTKCDKCCTKAYSLRRLRLEQSDIYRLYCSSPLLMQLVHSHMVNVLIHKVAKKSLKRVASSKVKTTNTSFEQLRYYYSKLFAKINFFLFNSNQSQAIYEQHLGYLPGIVLPTINSTIYDNRKKRYYGKTLRLGYLGNAMPQKGFNYLINELTCMAKTGRTNFQLNTYMLDSDTHPFVHNSPPYKSEQLPQVFDDMDLLIVPSLWKETFGMVVIEAISYGVPVLISKNVGARMVIEKTHGSGIVFPIKEGSLLQELINIYDHREMLVAINQKIITDSFCFDFKQHTKVITSQYIKVQKQIRMDRKNEC